MDGFIDIRYFGIDFTELRNIKIESLDLEHLKLKKQEQTNNRIDQAGITAYIYDVSTEQNVEVSYLKIVDNIKFNELVFGVIWVEETKEIKSYVKLNTSIKYYEVDGEIRGNNTKPLSIVEYRDFISQIKEYIESEYRIKIDCSEAMFEQLEIARLFSIEEKYCMYSPLLDAFYTLAPKTLWGYEKDKRKRAHGLEYERNKEYGKYVETMKLGNASMGEIIYNKTTQLRNVYDIELEIEFMKVELKLKTGTQCTKAFEDKTIYQITDMDMKEYFLKRVSKDLIRPYNDFIFGVNEEGRNKKISLSKKLEKRAKAKKYKNDKGKYKSGWATLYYSDVHRIKDKETGMLLAQDSQLILDVIKSITKSNYSRIYKNLIESIEESPEIKNNLVRYHEIKNKILNIE